jgi:hypothetical protein
MEGATDTRIVPRASISIYLDLALGDEKQKGAFQKNTPSPPRIAFAAFDRSIKR